MDSKTVKISNSRIGGDRSHIEINCLAFSIENKGTATAYIGENIDLKAGDTRTFENIDGLYYDTRLTLEFDATGVKDLLIIEMKKI